MSVALIVLHLLVPVQTPDWEDPQVFEKNREPPHASYIPYDTVERARDGRREASPHFQSLDGRWRFHWVAKPAHRPAAFFREDYDASAWAEIPVPGNWEVLGYGVPIYVDAGLPFAERPEPPFVNHEDNPVGSYRRSFSVPSSWLEGGEVFLHFGSVRSAMYVWVNEREVGYSEGSKTPAEFRITDFLRRGENTLAVEVYRYSDGSYLEDIDTWRLSGIEREVFLFWTPAVRMRDFFVRADLDEAFRDGRLEVDVDVAGGSAPLSFELLDPEGRRLLSGTEETTRLDLAVPWARKWTAETPWLYTLVLSVPGQVIATRVGFRRVAIEDGLLTAREEEGALDVAGDRFSIRFDLATGELASIVYEGVPILESGLVPNFWRAPTDNDYGNEMPRRLGVWREAARTRATDEVSWRQNSDRDVVVDVVATLLAGGSKLFTSYHVFGSGDVVVELRLVPGDPGLPDLPRFGTSLALRGGFENVEWFGRGPHESYWDRKSGARVGLHRGKASEGYHPYIRPQENGNKSDVRWVSLANEAGVGLLAVGLPLLDVSAYPFLNEDFDEGPEKRGRHAVDVAPRDLVTVNLDYRQMGVGGDTSWGARTHPEYTLPAREYSYRFRLRPFSGSDGLPAVLAKEKF